MCPGQEFDELVAGTWQVREPAVGDGRSTWTRGRLAGVQPIVRQVLDATNLSRMLALYDTAEQAARAEG